MPIYAYKCSTCQHERDVLQKISDPALSVCPQCGAATFSKQLTAAGFQLKGSGWYVTDFKNGPSADAKSAPKPAQSQPSEGKAAQAASDPAKESSPPKQAGTGAACGAGGSPTGG